MSVQVGIKYVGKKNRPYLDPVAGTGLVWMDTEQVHHVSESIAVQLLKHPDIFAEVDRKETKGLEPLAEVKVVDVKKEDEPERPPLVLLENMDRAALVVFAQSHFGQKLAHNMSEANMRVRIQNWMNSPMMGS